MPPSVGSVETTNVRLQSRFLDDVLPAQTVAIFFLNGADHDQGVVAFQPQILDDLAGVDHGGHAALLVAGAAAADHLVVFVAFVGVEFPVVPVAHTHGVYVGIHGNQMLAVADGAQDIAHGIDFDFVEAHLLHFFLDSHDNLLFLAAFAGQRIMSRKKRVISGL